MQNSRGALALAQVRFSPGKIGAGAVLLLSNVVEVKPSTEQARSHVKPPLGACDGLSIVLSAILGQVFYSFYIKLPTKP